MTSTIVDVVIVQKLLDALDRITVLEREVASVTLQLKQIQGGGGGSDPAITNRIIPALTTVADFDPAVPLAGGSIVGTPFGYVGATVNGLAVRIGDAVRTQEAYFSGDGGLTARAYGAVQPADRLYWVGSVAGYQLAPTDFVAYQFDS